MSNSRTSPLNAAADAVQSRHCPVPGQPHDSIADRIRRETEDCRRRCVEHSLFSRIKTLDDVRTFMSYHVYAVLDFMSLAYALRDGLMNRGATSAWVPWATPEVRRFVNEVILDECSDALPDGRVFSHFELYLEAMKAAGAATDTVLKAVELVRGGGALGDAVRRAGAPAAAVEFVSHTMALCNVGVTQRKPHILAAGFAFTREQVIPDMFSRIVESIGAQSSGRLDTFDLYLRRHIEMDGDKHGAMAEKMVDAVATPENVEECIRVTRAALEARATLWTAIEGALGA
jgi:hypothetical protein